MIPDQRAVLELEAAALGGLLARVEEARAAVRGGDFAIARTLASALMHSCRFIGRLDANVLRWLVAAAEQAGARTYPRGSDGDRWEGYLYDLNVDLGRELHAIRAYINDHR